MRLKEELRFCRILFPFVIAGERDIALGTGRHFNRRFPLQCYPFLLTVGPHCITLKLQGPC
jgi:hypothetical protein